LRSRCSGKDLIGEPLTWFIFGSIVVAECAFAIVRVNGRVMRENERSRREFEEKLKAATAVTTPHIDGGRSEFGKGYKLVCLVCGQEYSDQSLSRCPQDENVLSRVI